MERFVPEITAKSRAEDAELSFSRAKTSGLISNASVSNVVQKVSPDLQLVTIFTPLSLLVKMFPWDI
jgi:hypothetical protein